MPAVGEMPLEAITPEEIEGWSLTGLSNRSRNKLLIQRHGIFQRAQIVWGLPANPLYRVEKHPMRSSGDIQVFSPEELWALFRAAASEQDGALFLTAAFTGLRMGELLALRWRDADFGDPVKGSARRSDQSESAALVNTPTSAVSRVPNPQVRTVCRG